MSVYAMKNHFIILGHGVVPRVKSLCRDRHYEGWKVSATNVNGNTQALFLDSVCGGTYRAYRRAIAHIRRVSRLESPGQNLVLREKSTKQVRLDCPGVSLHTYSNAKGVLQYSFIVRDPRTGKIDEVYIGDELNCMERWDNALALAKSMRSRYVFIRSIETRMEV